MLNSHYQDIIVGKSYISVIYALIKLIKSKKSNSLLIDDQNAKMSFTWLHNIGQIDKMVLQNIGRTYNVECLKRIDDFVKPINTIVFLNEKMIEFGPSPFANIREMARKLPDIFNESYLKEFNSLDPEEFDQVCNNFFEQTAKLSISQIRLKDFFLTEDMTLNKIIDEFTHYLRGSELIKKQLHFVLQVLHQTFFTNTINDLDSKYLLISILSPRYLINEKELLEQLVFKYQEMGGHLTSSNIVDWEVYKRSSNYITLDSVDGVLNFENLYYFGRISSQTPFSRKRKETAFNSIIIECPLDHDFINFFKNKRILISENKRLGTDFPHWEFMINDQGRLHAIYSFANHEGTKPSFYFKKAAEDIFQSLKTILPGVNINDWAGQIEFKLGPDYWVESLFEESAKESSHISRDLDVFDLEGNGKIENINYCGPNRTKALGLLSYTLDLVQSV